MSAPTSRRVIAALCGVCLVFLLPFAGRPFHIDDPLFIWSARQIVRHPTDFYGFVVNWEGFNRPADKIFLIPPLTSYYFAGISRLTGWRPFLLHISVLPFTMASVTGTYLLAARFCRRPALAAILFLFCPAFFVSSTTLMCEPPLLCFWIWAVLCWIWGSENSIGFLAISAALMAAAILTKFTALGLVPLLICYSVLKPARPGTGPAQFFALLVPLLTAWLYDTYFRHLYGFGAFANAADYSNHAQAMLKTPAVLRIFDSAAFVGGGAVIAPLLVLLVVWRWWVTAAFSLGMIFFAALSHGSFVFDLQWNLMIGAGGVLLIQIYLRMAKAFRSSDWRDEAFLLCWMGGLFIFAAFLNWSINIRSVLPMMPALCILTVGWLDRMPRLPKVRSACVILIGGGISVAVAVGDYQLAATIQSAANQIPHEAGSGHKLWFVGHWGFQYYMQLAGAGELDTAHPQYQIGDYVVFPMSGYGGTPAARGFQLIRNISVGHGGWISTANVRERAGFYQSDGYDLPFVFGPFAPESFALVQVTADSQLGN